MHMLFLSLCTHQWMRVESTHLLLHHRWEEKGTEPEVPLRDTMSRIKLTLWAEMY